MDENRNLLTAPLYTRVIAFLIDTVVACLPFLIMMMLVVESPSEQHLLAPLLYAAPIEGTYTLRELPLEVNQAMNDALAGTTEYASTEIRNVSLSSTFLRMLSVFVILFYLFYDTVATVLFDGVTVGKYCMGIQTVYVRDGKPTVGILLRQILGKIILNSLGVFVISIFSMIFTRKHYAVHDLIGGTRVVYMTTQKRKFSFSGLRENIREREGMDQEDSEEETGDVTGEDPDNINISGSAETSADMNAADITETSADINTADSAEPIADSIETVP